MLNLKLQNKRIEKSYFEIFKNIIAIKMIEVNN